jgi:orotidine-5'-phosphate decarboxylase
MNMDTLFDAVALRGPVCVGLDTALDYIPQKALRQAGSPSAALLAFNKAIIEATSSACACYKVQIAYYEEHGIEGLRAYAETLRHIRKLGLPVIADIKRGDIADTAARYAKAHLDGEFEADFVTLSPYMGMDSLDPWLEYVGKKGKGLFVLMRTSNKGMRDFEYRELAGGGRLYDAVGDKIQALATQYRGARGYGAVGAVVGCTEREEAAAIRASRPEVFFLIPGYGAQGGAAADAALLLRDGNGGIVNASRSILKAWQTLPDAANKPEQDLDQIAFAAQSATVEMQTALRKACSPRVPGKQPRER